MLKEETIMTEITDILKSSKIILSKKSKDGRINSTEDEEIIIKAISESQKFQELSKKYNLKLSIPKIRNWYDFAVESEEQQDDLFIPVNIKSSKLKTADNINTKLGLFYACTGIKPETIGLSEGCHWSHFYDVLVKHMDSNIDRDYYFLIINKNDIKDTFWTSMKKLNKATPNCSNRPFQCNWNKNRELIHRTHEEAREFLMDAFIKSYLNDKRYNGIEQLFKYCSKEVFDECKRIGTSIYTTTHSF